MPAGGGGSPPEQREVLPFTKTVAGVPVRPNPPGNTQDVLIYFPNGK